VITRSQNYNLTSPFWV